MKLIVTMSETETYEVRTKGIDTVTAERRYKGLKDTNAVESSFYMAWNVSKREGKTDLAFDEWLAIVEDVAPEEDPEEESPLGSSSGS